MRLPRRPRPLTDLAGARPAPSRRWRPGAGVVVALAVLTPLAACGQTEDPTIAADDGQEETLNGVAPDGATDGDPAVDQGSGIQTVAGMPPVVDPSNIYSEAGSDNVNPATEGSLYRVYVPNEVSGNLSVIDPTTMEVIDTFATGSIPQHVVPSYDMKTLYVLNNSGNTIVPIDPLTGKAEPAIPVDDPYNLYFTPDGSEGIVVAEAEQRLDFTDPKTFEVHSSIQTDCNGMNHLDYTIDGRSFIATCEFDGRMIKVDIEKREVVGALQIDISQSGKQNPIKDIAQPQDVRLSNDGKVFYVADLITDGVYLIDAETFTQIGFIRTGVAAHGLYPSRDGQKLYVVNRGTNAIPAPGSFKGKAKGSIAVLDFATRAIVDEWVVPDNGSPDMGNLTADGKQLWLGGRYDGEVYVFDTEKGELINRIKVGQNPHGLTVWPQPGRFSFGHTGNMR
jgi:YVTN family beta-propeller protein